MKRTRNLFLLKGAKEALSHVFQEVRFKGLTSFTHEITVLDIVEVFNNNKSVLCVNVPPEYQFKVIEIPVLTDVNHDSDSSDSIILSKGNIADQFQEIADKHNCDIGDHVTNSSGLNGAPNVEDCGYCRFWHQKVYDIDLPKLVVYQSEHFFVLPTLGEFITGYLLIIPIDHVMSLAELDFFVRQEFLDVLNDITTILNLTYQPKGILVWENGTGNSGRGKAKDSIVHAHVHVAPSTLTATKVQEISAFPFKKVSIHTLSDYGNHSYLLIKSAKECDWKISSDPALYIPRQYIRQLIAEEYQIPDEQWNWREYPYTELRFRTALDIYEAMRKNWSTLPERIRNNIHVFMSNFDA